ncbi:hypothetical protein CU098_002202, partial [Rhizopus stolonifer]
VQVQVRDSDLKIDVFRASGAGGQHVNTTDSAVRITHIPTGLVVAMQDERSQHKNKQKALKVLRAKIYDQERIKSEKTRRDSRNKQIGTGDRSEKIRTYNYPQNRVTDHRINLTLYELDLIMSGENLLNVIEPLQERQLADSTNNRRTGLQSLENNHSQEADEGFASTSSIEEDQTTEVIRRKRSVHHLAETEPNTLLEKKSQKFNSLNRLELVLWVVSFFWVFAQFFDATDDYNSPYCVWILILWLGLLYSHVSKKETNFVNEQSSSDEYNHDYDGDKRLKPATQSQTSLSRIFGANQSSFRNDADDGLLCGVLLLPMVTASKLSDLLKSNDGQEYIAYVQARLELLFIMGVLLLILVFVNEHLRPLKRSGAVLVYGTMEYIYIAYFPSSKPNYLKKEDVSPVSMLVHVLIVGMIFIGVITYPLLRESRKIAQKPYWRSNKTSFFKSKKLLFGSLFYLATIFVVLLILSPFCKAILELDPFLWTIHFLHASPSRIFLCLYWFLMM